MTMRILFALMYVWAGVTMLYALEQIENIGEELNPITTKLDLPPIKAHIQGSLPMRLILIAIWPTALPIWIYMALFPARKETE
ncbi:MAG TPA: hypothetical protein PLN42_04600 [Anaerolineae bacterium]|nr:hypothetical protein [Anaerolineae bacterium]